MQVLPKKSNNAEVAQLVEHSPEERRVGGSRPPLSTNKTKNRLFKPVSGIMN